MLWMITVQAPLRRYFTEAPTKDAALELVRVNYPQLRDVAMDVVQCSPKEGPDSVRPRG